jgi:pimeloyl-ACP methyl ester carboxylesterase
MVSLPNGVALRVVECGAQSERAVLLLHGWGASSYMWRHWFIPLANAGYHVLAPDLPGHGLSDKPDDDVYYTCDALVDTVLALMDVEGLRDADVVAQSMAGTIAVDLARRVPERVGKLILVNPVLFGRVRLERLFKLVSPPIIDAFLPRLVRRWVVARAHRVVYGDPTRLNEQDVDEYWAPSQFPGYARAMRRLLHSFRWDRPGVDSITATLAPLAQKLLVILGTKDRLVLDARPYVAALHARLPSIVVREVIGGGHAVNEERPEEVVPLGRAFLLGL